MARPKNAVPTVRKELALPAPLLEKIDTHLKSGLLGAAPLGAYSEFFASLAHEFFANSYLDLAPYLPGELPGLYVLRAPKSVLDRLEQLLKQAQGNTNEPDHNRQD